MSNPSNRRSFLKLLGVMGAVSLLPLKAKSEAKPTHYAIGERGPEMFIPHSDQSVVINIRNPDPNVYIVRRRML